MCMLLCLCFRVAGCALIRTLQNSKSLILGKKHCLRPQGDNIFYIGDLADLNVRNRMYNLNLCSVA